MPRKQSASLASEQASSTGIIPILNRKIATAAAREKQRWPFTPVHAVVSKEKL